MSFPMKKITIYHKTSNGWIRYNKMASVRQNNSLKLDTTGQSITDTIKIRIFDFDGYKNTWNCDLKDVIVNQDVNDEITEAPISEMNAKYGKENVYQVQSVTPYLFGRELDHIKIECK